MPAPPLIKPPIPTSAQRISTPAASGRGGATARASYPAFENVPSTQNTGLKGSRMLPGLAALGVATGVIGTAHSAVSNLSMAGFLTGLLAMVLPQNMRSGANKVSSALSLPYVAHNQLPEAVGEVFGQDSRIARGVSGAAGKIGPFAKQTLGSRVSGVLAERSTGEILLTGVLTTSATAMVAGGIFGKAETLCRMQYDLTGKMPTRLSVFFGDKKTLHPLVIQARKEAYSLQALIPMGANLGVIGYNLFSIFSHQQQPQAMVNGNRRDLMKFMGKQMAINAVAQYGVPALTKILTSTHIALPAYQEAYKLQAAGQPITAETYVGLVGGLIRGISERDAYKIAIEYEKGHKTLREAMQDIAVKCGHPVGKHTEAAQKQKVAAAQQKMQFALP